MNEDTMRSQVEETEPAQEPAPKETLSEEELEEVSGGCHAPEPTDGPLINVPDIFIVY
jgi:bacteriocin-like protein